MGRLVLFLTVEQVERVAAVAVVLAVLKTVELA
jgi:hypothetical protein